MKTRNVRFALGQVLATPNAIFYLAQHQCLALSLVARHQRGDWGDVCPDDALSNDEAVNTQGRLLSSYAIGDGKVWVITEADRSVTTLLLPEEY